MIEEIAQPLDHDPAYIWEPFFDPPVAWNGHQNTDPFVFGGFYYSICRQSARPSLRELAPGSVLVFGSRVAGAFVADTIFVVRQGVWYTRNDYRTVLRGHVPEQYFQVVLDPFFASAGSCGEGHRLRLYVGATVERPHAEMFSFFPAIPSLQGGRGFRRPALQLPGYISAVNWRNIKVTEVAGMADMQRLWQGIVNAVLSNGLWLGTHAEVPPRADQGRALPATPKGEPCRTP